MVTHPLFVVAFYGAAGDGDVLVGVDGPVAGALPVELVRQALHRRHEHTHTSQHQTKSPALLDPRRSIDALISGIKLK